MENLPRWNVVAQISENPSPSADINHWMIYYDVEGKLVPRSTIGITHVDRPGKLHVLRDRLNGAELGICMSRMTMEQLVRAGVPKEKLCYILPAHDSDVTPKRIVIGITTQIRPDGAKRENVLIKTAKAMRLDAFHFSIIGPHWEKILPILEASGATVDYSPGSQENEKHRKMVLQRLALFDYYLYMGWDEGSMGFLDALAAGVPTIVTPQGFHLDIPGGISYTINDHKDLSTVFRRLAEARQQRINCVSGLTWDKYAYDHARVWRAIVMNQTDGLNKRIHSEGHSPLPPINTSLSPISPYAFGTYLYTGGRSLMSDLFLMLRYHTGMSLVSSRISRLAKSIAGFLGR